MAAVPTVPPAALESPAAMPGARRLRSRSPAPLVGAVAVLMLAFAASARLAREVERGALLPFFDTYEVARVELLGVSLYADVSLAAGDLVTAAAMAAVAAVLLCAARILRRRGAPEARPLTLAGLGSAFLAADDLLGAHETVGHNLGFLASLPIVDHPDDAIVGVYLAIAVAFAVHHRHLLRGAARVPAALAGALVAVAGVHDLLPLHHSRLEEGAELGAGLALFATVALLVRGLLREDGPAG